MFLPLSPSSGVFFPCLTEFLSSTNYSIKTPTEPSSSRPEMHHPRVHANHTDRAYTYSSCIMSVSASHAFLHVQGKVITVLQLGCMHMQTLAAPCRTHGRELVACTPRYRYEPPRHLHTLTHARLPSSVIQFQFQKSPRSMFPFPKAAIYAFKR